MGNGSWFIVHGNLLFVGYLFLLARLYPPLKGGLKSKSENLLPLLHRLFCQHSLFNKFNRGAAIA